MDMFFSFLGHDGEFPRATELRGSPSDLCLAVDVVPVVVLRFLTIVGFYCVNCLSAPRNILLPATSRCSDI